ncbi:MAG TPA: hypothetical protein VKB96_15765 [Gammaproteobacteria bacterium]|nr:hypothetical protein [Gammaproteobacteria bacterium]
MDPGISNVNSDMVIDFGASAFGSSDYLSWNGAFDAFGAQGLIINTDIF